MTTAPSRIGLLGAGNIARRYVDGIRRFPELQVVGCVDVIPAAAAALADATGIRAYDSVDEMLADPAIDIVVNITPPVHHAASTIAALEAGKHVYVEKPMAASLTDARAMIAAAERTGRRLGCAPDTFLGSAGLTARAAIADGAIGRVFGASAFITHSRAETWHPDPTFLFQPGGGPMLDLGPYYVTALVAALGPIEHVTALTGVGSPERTVMAPDRRVDTIEVTTPTHAAAVVGFASGAIGQAMMSFDVWDARLPRMEIYGTEGTLSLPDPNEFDGDVLLRRHDDTEWRVLPPVVPASGEPGAYEQFLRGPGVADLAAAIGGAEQAASPELAVHVLEVLDAIQGSSESGRRVVLTTGAALSNTVHKIGVDRA